jgi:hypothetical protein
MADIVVTVPKNFRYGDKVGLAAWLSEGDAPGDPWSGDSYDFTTWGFCPKIQKGERVYVVCEARLVGYAPLTYIMFGEDLLGTNRPTRVQDSIVLGRAGGAVACTIDLPIVGFRGWRYRWWDREDEKPLDLSPWLNPQPKEPVKRQRAKPVHAAPLFD